MRTGWRLRFCRTVRPMDKDPKDMTDEELLEEIAALDPDKFPLADRARRVLGDRS
mgnify:CR=1 FL=1